MQREVVVWDPIQLVSHLDREDVINNNCCLHYCSSENTILLLKPVAWTGCSHSDCERQVGKEISQEDSVFCNFAFLGCEAIRLLQRIAAWRIHKIIAKAGQDRRNEVSL